MPRRRLPIGIQSFRRLRETDSYYVDKTSLIGELVGQGDYYFLSRPRRFGKSLLLDTLKSLFEGHEPLFRGLAIHPHWDWSSPHPVVRLSFDGKYDEPGDIERNVLNQLALVEHGASLDTGPVAGTGPERLQNVLYHLHHATSRQVVVLVDEYDKPILDVLHDPALARANRDYLRGFYGIVKDSAAHVRFVFVTGVSMFSKVSLFSGLNNLEDISLDPRFATLCGYRDEDLDRVFGPELAGLDREEIRTWYNGYHWRGGERVYNPYDVLPRFPDKAGTGSEKERTLRAKSAILPLEMRSPRRCAMDTVIPRPPQVEMDFTDARLTGFGGWSVLGQMAARLDLPRALSAVSVKQRARGASDAETLWSLIASLAAGNGALSALDALREDRVGQRLLGLGRVPSGRRLGEYLARIDEAQVETLLAVARGLAAQVAPAVVEHEAAVRGYVPVFVDGTAIEVDGKLFEEARRGYDGTRQYWLHGVFIGTLWVSGRLHPGGGDVAGGWRGQLDSDVAPCLPEGTPVWLRADNAYYRGELIAWCRERGWDYSISLTHARKRAPVLDVVEGLPEDGWTDIGLGEDATLVRYRPAGWEEQSYVVIRRRRDRGQTLLLPVYTVILVSRDDLPLDELVRRHRGKQGQENAFKGPLIDLDLHHPPCRRFRANQAFYICGQIAQVLLRAVQYQLLPARARRHGLRPLIRYLVRVVGRLVRSGRRWRLDFARNNFRLDWLYHAAVQLE